MQIEDTQDLKWLATHRLAGKSHTFNILMTLFFRDDDEGQLRVLGTILVLYEGISGLHIYRTKSQLSL